MFLSVVDIGIIILGFVWLAIWMFFYIKGKKNAELFEGLDETEFRLKDIYFVGYEVLETFKYKYRSRADRRLKREIEVLYDPRYVDYYLRVIHAQKMTVAMTILQFAFIAYGLTQEILIFFILVGMAGLMYYYFGTMTTKKLTARSEEMLSDFSEVISKLALMTNAGMILREAWELIAYGDETAVYKEMQKTVEDMRNGMSEIDAYHAFGKRCVIPEIKKFSATIIQGVTKGSSELVLMLQDQNKEIWEAKKQSVKRQGEKAASKLLFPMVVMFLGILIMIMIPIFSNLGI